MYKKIRKSLAESVATLENPDQFHWSKWLREPQIYLERFPKPRIAIRLIDSYKSFEKPALFQVSKFALSKSRISEEIRNVTIKKKKTFKIFFTYPKTFQNEIPIFPPDTVRIIFLASIYSKDKGFFLRIKNQKSENLKSFYPKCSGKTVDPILVNVNSFQIKLIKGDSQAHNCVLSKPNNSEYKICLPSTLPSEKIFNLSILREEAKRKYLALAFNPLNKRPKVKSLTVAKLEDLKEELERSGVLKLTDVEIEKLNSNTKHYHVKFVSIEKIKVPLFQLKNLNIKAPLQKAVEVASSENIKVKTEKINTDSNKYTEVLNPGILEELKSIVSDKTNNYNKSKKTKSIAIKMDSERRDGKVNWDEIESENKNLLKYQIEGAKFLLSNRSALICDELGINKKEQVLFALNVGMQHGLIKKALILCPESNIGNRLVGEHVDNSDDWVNKIVNLLPDTSVLQISSNGREVVISEDKNREVYLLGYKTFYENTSSNTTECFPKDVDCLILDEAQYFLESDVKDERYFDFPQFLYKWVLSSLPSQITEERFLPKLKNQFDGFDNLDHILSRTKYSLGSGLPSITRNDYWLEPDKEQAQEFENTILQGRRRIIDLVKGGNPFIIQSNIFTLIHQIKQVGNFSTHKDSSPKSELLLHHLDCIISSGQKSIIFSQYDKQGIQKLEKLLKANHIKYVLYQSGMPLKELESSATAFKKDSKISVMLAGLTAASIKVKIPDASYLIHFDQWWNPTTQWQYEDRTVQSNDSHVSVNVLNYFCNNSIELSIREVLNKKGFLTKNLIEFLSNETIYNLISNEDWLNILGVDQSETNQSSNSDFESIYQDLSFASLQDIGHKTKTLFTKLGYKNLLIKPDMLHEELAIYGNAVKEMNEIKTAIFCLPFKVKELEPVESFIKEAIKNNSRIFVICSDEICQQAVEDPIKNIVYIGQKQFALYLSQFKIV
ncbi:MAG: DEAD/DEAH box helicase [Ignavibacteriaceae bacterium]|nr:DEAD/DEAH box helicase [Ignavibacteriaceae bacterium]